MRNIPARADVRQPCEYPGCPNGASHAILCRAHFNYVPAAVSRPLLAAWQADDAAAYDGCLEKLRAYLKGLKGGQR